MSKCYDVECSKGNYAAYVKKNMPHNIHYTLLFLSYISITHYYLRFNRRLPLTLLKLCGIINLSKDWVAA